MVWGKKVGNEVHYNIVSYLDEHNETLSLEDIILPDLWYRYLYPATQCGRRSDYDSIYWDTKFSQ